MTFEVLTPAHHLTIMVSSVISCPWKVGPLVVAASLIRGYDLTQGSNQLARPCQRSDRVIQANESGREANGRVPSVNVVVVDDAGEILLI